MVATDGMSSAVVVRARSVQSFLGPQDRCFCLSATSATTTSGLTARLFDSGRRDWSTRPAVPCAWKRRSHL
jgi:hypothetical protein